MNRRDKAVDDWDDFCSNIKFRNRFFIDEGLRKEFENILRLHEHTLNIGTKLYRARAKEYRDTDTQNKMGPPPKGKSSVGRANPKGISYFYLAEDIETAISEIKPFIKQTVTVAEFEIISKQYIVDFDADIPIPQDEYTEQLALMISIWYSLPIDYNNLELEYLPFQYVSELAKNLGYDGIRYKSYLSNSRKFNVVLFAEEYTKQIDSKVYEISNIKYDFEVKQ